MKEAKEKADQGVIYSPMHGAVCPSCKKNRLKVVTTRPWQENERIRFHKCTNPECVLNYMQTSIKSVEVDNELC